MAEERVIAEDPEDEVVLSESVSDEARRIRIYDSGGDFIIEVPAKATITFSYFNPSAAGGGSERLDNWGEGRNRNTFKTTALRIYETNGKSNQLACFIGVLGFRDLRVKKTKLVQRVVVERRYSDDGEGKEDWSGQRELTRGSADEDGDIPF
jgi:hypothetical protein